MKKVGAVFILLGWIAWCGYAEAGVGYGRGGPNRYAKTFVLDLSAIVDQVDQAIKNGDSQFIDVVRIKRDLADICEGKCSEQSLLAMKTVEEDKEKIRIIREMIYQQVLRILLQIRENRNSQTLKEWDEIMMKLKKMRMELLGPGSSSITGSVIIHREKL